MLELIIGLLTPLVPILLKFICDKMSAEQIKPVQKQDNVRRLYEAKTQQDMARAWGAHDKRVRDTLARARASTR